MIMLLIFQPDLLAKTSNHLIKDDFFRGNFEDVLSNLVVQTQLIVKKMSQFALGFFIYQNYRGYLHWPSTQILMQSVLSLNK